MANSRIFVQGLPPSITDADFRAHFSRKHPVTDIKLMPQRRIGYVGYKHPEDAESAIKYFNKSFMRMSKLRVEPAQGFSPARYHGNTTVRSQDLEQRPLKMLGADQPNRKRRRNEDAETEAERNHKRINIPSDSRLNHVHLNPLNENIANKIDLGPDGPKASDSDASQEKVDAEQPFRDADDADWMRSRTSRLLGLADDDEYTRDSSVPVDVASSSGQDIEQSGSLEPPTLQSPTQEPATDKKINDPINLGATDEKEKAEPISRRLFLRNLAFGVAEDDIAALLKPYDTHVEVQLPHDFQTGGSKGFAFAEFQTPQAAIEAMHALDGMTFQGRLLHMLLASNKRQSKIDEYSLAQLPLKKRRLVEKKQQVSSATFSWNSMFMNADAVLSSTAARLGVAKSEVLDPTSSDAAVKQAQAETNTIQATKSYFLDQGVNFDSLSHSKRDGHALLVKNFRYDTSSEDLKTLFAENTDLKIVRVLMPPTGTIAIVEFANEVQASSALQTFAYRKFRDSILFLERAPQNIFAKSTQTNNEFAHVKKDPKITDSVDDENVTDTSTVFVRNLNFSTTSERLWKELHPLTGLKSAVVKTRKDPKNEGKSLSMGFGFLEFATKEDARAAISAMNKHVLDGHELQFKMSQRGQDAAAERRQQDAAKRQKDRGAKLVIKNLPFEASKKDVRNLFKSYGQLRALRMPKKLNSGSRGYAFAHFKTHKEAENALNALSSTHLLGRRLVLHYAADESEDPEEQIAMMQQKVGKQAESVALQRLTASQRKKLNLEELNEAEGG